MISLRDEGIENSMGEEQALLEAAVRVDLAGKSGEAAHLYEKLVGALWVSEPVRVTAAYHLGHCRAREKDWPGAIGALEQAASANEDDPVRRMARLDLAELLMKTGAAKAALIWFERLLIEGKPDSISRLHVVLRNAACQLAADQRPSETISNELPPSGELVPEVTAGAWFEAAYGFEVANDLATAAEWYERLLDRPGLSAVLQANARFRCGFVSEARLDWKRSLEHYERCVNAPRVYPLAQDLARLYLANLRYAFEEYDEAARQYQELKMTDALSAAQQAQVRLRYGRCLVNIGNADAGERELGECRELYPESEVSVQADLLLADIYGERADLRAAVACYRRVIEHPYAEPSVKALARMCALELGSL